VNEGEQGRGEKSCAFVKGNILKFGFLEAHNGGDVLEEDTLNLRTFIGLAKSTNVPTNDGNSAITHGEQN